MRVLFDYGGTLIERENSNMHFKREFWGDMRSSDRNDKEMDTSTLHESYECSFCCKWSLSKVLNKNFGKVWIGVGS